MSFFEHKKKKSSLHTFLTSVLIFAALLLLFTVGISAVSHGTRKRQKEALENALTHYITECYAEEGYYPKDVYYLQEHYGLRFNEDRFYVDYHVNGKNVRPEFTVIERKGAD